MSAEGQLQVWWHRTEGGKDLAESQDVSNEMGARAAYLAAERAGYHAIKVMKLYRGHWVRVPNRSIELS